MESFKQRDDISVTGSLAHLEPPRRSRLCPKPEEGREGNEACTPSRAHSRANNGSDRGREVEMARRE